MFSDIKTWCQARNSINQGKLGTNRNILTDAKGISLALKLTDAIMHGGRMLNALMDAVPPICSCW